MFHDSSELSLILHNFENILIKKALLTKIGTITLVCDQMESHTSKY